MNQSFLFFELIGVFIVHWLILEPQTYVVVEQFGAENIPLLSGRLVFEIVCNHNKVTFPIVTPMEKVTSIMLEATVLCDPKIESVAFSNKEN